MIIQPKGSVIHDIEINTISKILGIEKERIAVVRDGLVLNSYDVLIEPVSGKYFDCSGKNITVESWEISGNSLVLNGSAVLDSLSLQSSTGASYIGTSTNGGIYSVQDVLNCKQYIFSISCLSEGCIADRITDNTQKIQNIINQNEHCYIIIEPNIYYHYLDLVMKNTVNLIDMSGYDDVNSQWNEHIKYHFNNISDTENNNGNTFHILSHHNPAFIIDNNGDENDPEGEERQASIIFRYQGQTAVRVGVGRDSNDNDFVITDSNLSSRFSFRSTNSTDYEMSFNMQPIPSVDYSYGINSKNSGNTIHRYYNNDERISSFSHFFGNNEIIRSVYNYNGKIETHINGVIVNTLNEYGQTNYRVNTITGQDIILTLDQSCSIINNIDIDIQTIKLPQLITNSHGIMYTIHKKGGSSIVINTNSNNTFIDSSIAYEITDDGEYKIVQYNDNQWYVI